VGHPGVVDHDGIGPLDERGEATDRQTRHHVGRHGAGCHTTRELGFPGAGGDDHAPARLRRCGRHGGEPVGAPSPVGP
jgi:general stress protein YciG